MLGMVLTSALLRLGGQRYNGDGFVFAQNFAQY
jgi:hypothetical protein